MNKNITGAAICFFAIIVLLSGCNKVNIQFGESSSELDPSITYYDNYETEISTYRVDSFLTSSHNLVSIGYHNDPDFGVVKAGSFVQVSLPASNPVFDVNVTFDSLVMILKPNGVFYGDSTKPVKVNVYRLSDNIKRSDGTDYYYNTSSFGYLPNPIGEQTVNLAGKSGTQVKIRLSDDLGKELLEKFRTNASEITTSELFVDYFRGLYICTDSSVTSLVSYFSVPADSAILRLSYHENGLYAVAKNLDFNYSTAKQFNHVSFRAVNSNLVSIEGSKYNLVSSTASGNKAFLYSPVGTGIKISFPSLLTLKEKYPYMRVIKAMLVIKPDVASLAFPYSLPPKLYLYSTDDTNELLGGFYDGTTTTASLLTGDLVIDNLYGENTYYSYDITTFINNKITTGQFSKTAIMLTSSLSSFDAGVERLIVNDQTQKNSIQFKMYVLGM